MPEIIFVPGVGLFCRDFAFSFFALLLNVPPLLLLTRSSWIQQKRGRTAQGVNNQGPMTGGGGGYHHRRGPPMAPLVAGEKFAIRTLVPKTTAVESVASSAPPARRQDVGGCSLDGLRVATRLQQHLGGEGIVSTAVRPLFV